MPREKKNMDKKDSIFELLQKPLWQLSGAEYVALHAYACSINTDSRASAPQVTRVKGVRALAEHCSCSESLVYKLLREGILDPAILSRVGKSIVFNGEVALRCASEYQEQQRAKRKNAEKKEEYE